MSVEQRLVGNSPALAQALDQLSQLAPINRPILVLGERGTGKELAAERLHFLSERWDEILIKVNCAAISDQLLESELFGHEPGAFTGATRTHHGRFERADGGTLFLDELANMSLSLQEKLLRLIEYGEFERLGGQETLTVDVRLVAATNAQLPAMAKRGDFREDLLDRLSFDVVHLPPLRFRREDISELANHFGVQICHELEWAYFQGFSRDAMEKLEHHDWPGNVRELKNVVERSVYRWGSSTEPVDDIVIDPFFSPYLFEQTGQQIERQETRGATSRDAGENSKPADNDLPTHNDTMASTRNLAALTAGFQRRLIEQCLADHRGHQGKTAKALELTYDQLRGLLRKHDIDARRWS